MQAFSRILSNSRLSIEKARQGGY
ncbi:hypothetical protein S40285_10766, partial [Stachybotrys chlorohalonatus IBT 40285]